MIIDYKYNIYFGNYIMKIYRGIFLLVFMMVCRIGFSQAVDYQYRTEYDILNQFTVMEDGAGDLKPGYYYDLYHKHYKELNGHGYGNPATAKKVLRWSAEEIFKKEPDKAEAMKDTLKHRRNIEVMNMAERKSDLSVMGEKKRFRNNMSVFKNNINNLMLYGGQAQDKQQWMEVYNAYSTGFNAISEAYMPAGERSKEYVALNKSLLQQNAVLVRQISALYAVKRGQELKKNSNTFKFRDEATGNKVIAYDRMNQWGSLAGITTPSGTVSGGRIGLVRK